MLLALLEINISGSTAEGEVVALESTKSNWVITVPTGDSSLISASYTATTPPNGYAFAADLEPLYISIIKILDEVAIPSIEATPASVVGYYNLMGQRLNSEPAQGVYIVLYSNGTAKKVFRSK